MKRLDRAALIEALESKGYYRNRRLQALDVPRATYYRWKRRYEEGGIVGVGGQKPAARRIWNRKMEQEINRVLEVAKDHPELSCRLLAAKITDEGNFYVSESTVYRTLKERGLIEPRALEDLPAAKEWRHKTTAPDQIWQCDATNFFVVGCGFYKGIPVMDDYSRKILSFPVKPDESSYSIADAMEEALEAARQEGHALEKKPVLLSDNGPGFWGKILAQYLNLKGIGHIFGRPYHPQTQGKVEAVNKKIKGRVNLLVYCSSEELERAIREAVKQHNATPREALKNVSPNDVYAGRQEGILKRRAELKQLTLQRRKEYNLARPPKLSGTHSGNLSQKV